MRREFTLAAMALVVTSGVMSGCSLVPGPAPTPKSTSATAEMKPAVIDPGDYSFKATVASVRILELNTQDKLVNGVASIQGEWCVFTGIDSHWGVRLDVQEVDKPLWFLKAGEPVTFVVHSPTHLFGKSGTEAVGQLCQFSLTISRRQDGSLYFGTLTTPAGSFAAQGGFNPQK